jgi:5,10-methylenetetrahydromethanopterin reductase
MAITRFGIGMGRHLTTKDVGAHAAAAEEYGFEHLTILDDITLTRDVYVMLTLAALATSKIQIGHGVTHPRIRHAAQTAAATASLHEVSDGRAFLGIGAGALYSLVGELNGRIAETRETILASRHLARGEAFELANGTKIHSPWMKDPFPIYVAAEGPRGLQMAGELGDAVWTLGFHPVLREWRFDHLKRGAAQADRPLDDVDVWLRTMVVMADSKEEGRDIARPYCATIAHQFALGVLNRDNEHTRRLKELMPDDLLDDYARARSAWDYYQHETYGAEHAKAVSDAIVDTNVIVGTPEQCAEMITEIIDMGFDGISMTVYLHEDKIKFFREFAADVMPLLA